jgi:hypothetical protein
MEADYLDPTIDRASLLHSGEKNRDFVQKIKNKLNEYQR